MIPFRPSIAGSPPSAVRRLAPALLAMLVLAGSALPAAGHSPDPTLGAPFGQDQALRYRWAAGAVPPADMRAAINRAASASNASRASRAATFAHDPEGGNAIAYGGDVPCGVNGLACFRRSAPDWFGIWLRPNGHRFDWGVLRWCELAGEPDGCFDAENVTLDELGHVLGLDHHQNFADQRDYEDAVVQTYTRARPKSGWNAHVYGRCDVATLQQVYDLPTTTTRYSTCLDVPTVTTLAASQASVTAGTMVTFGATLRTDGTKRLSNNPVSSRTVVLQRRTSSGWTDVLAMNPGSAAGAYAGSLTLWSGGTYRALFRRPADEGLRASSSASVSITVTSSCTTGLCPQAGSDAVE